MKVAMELAVIKLNGDSVMGFLVDSPDKSGQIEA